MEVKQAVAAAKKYVEELFAGESPASVGLEEVEFDDDLKQWLVTVGFVRPWDKSGMLADFSPPPRTYKIITISDATGKALSIRNREPARVS